jgi:hypothetical protein
MNVIDTTNVVALIDIDARSQGLTIHILDPVSCALERAYIDSHPRIHQKDIPDKHILGAG